MGRIAPSPTGRMHLGNVYAALAAWLGARASGGVVRLRIEDIDRPRVVADADRWIMDDLAWLGLDWDGPVVYQSQREGLYRQAMEHLEGLSVEEVAASLGPAGGAETGDSGDGSKQDVQPLIYPCFCSRADIRAASAPNEGDGFILYPGTCRGLDRALAQERVREGRRHAWRIAVPGEGRPGSVCRFDDAVYGAQTFDLPHALGDVVVVRSDGIVSYQLAVSVDDLEMGVNQVVRGRDLLRSTGIQLWIRQGLQAGAGGDFKQAQPVSWAHLPLVDGADGRRLSKRFGSLDLGTLRDRGSSPQQVVGLCAWLLGLVPRAEPVEAASLVERFEWSAVAADRQDRVVDEELLSVLA